MKHPGKCGKHPLVEYVIREGERGKTYYVCLECEGKSEERMDALFPAVTWDCNPFTGGEIEEYMKQESAPKVDRIKATIRSLQDRIITEGETMGNNGWISVEERLPEPRQWVLSWVKTNPVENSATVQVQYGPYFGTHGIDYTDESEVVCWDGHARRKWQYVTHWQPLPDPPQ